MSYLTIVLSFFFFNEPAATEIYTLSLHDALPICQVRSAECGVRNRQAHLETRHSARPTPHSALRSIPGTHADRKSTRLNSSHRCISYAVFCLKKKNQLPPRLSLTVPQPSIHLTTP